MRLHLRLITLAVVAAGLIGAVLSLTILDTDEGSNVPEPGAPLNPDGLTGETGTTLDFAQPIPLPLNGPLLGVNLTAYSPEGYADPSVERAIHTLAGLGSTAITLVPTWYMQSPGDTVIAPEPDKSPSDESLAQAIEWIREAGMQVLIKPHVDIVDDSFRGDIQPADRAAWYRSYDEFIDHYATFSAEYEADLFVVGTELKTMSADTGRWREIIRRTRGLYVGPVTYAANWDEVEQVAFWDELDAIGVDAYYPLTAESGTAPTLEDLEAAWRLIARDLGRLARSWSRPVLLTEVGYPSQAGATANPFSVTGEPPDQNIQALAYEATFNVLSGLDWIEGISWWSWRADPTGQEDMRVEYTPEGKKAQGQLAAGQFSFVD